MKSIFVINDGTIEAEHAGKFALDMARQMKANIVLANSNHSSNKFVEIAIAGNVQKNTCIERKAMSLFGYLTELNYRIKDYCPLIHEADISDMDELHVAEAINKTDCLMVIKGLPADLPMHSVGMKHVNMDTILKNIHCPLLMIPETWPIKPIERLVYIADLRYCRMQIMSFLVNMAKAWQASLSIAHLSAKWIPDMEEAYAQQVFNQHIHNKINYDQVYFNKINEPDINAAIDVLINGMHNDMIALISHRFHFDALLGKLIPDQLPGELSVPLLIFPC